MTYMIPLTFGRDEKLSLQLTTKNAVVNVDQTELF